MPVLRFVPNAAQNAADYGRPWVNLSNALGDTASFASRGTGTGTVLRPVAFGAWRTQSDALSIAHALPANAIIASLTAVITARSSGPAWGTANWTSTAVEVNYPVHSYAGSLSTALSTSFSQRQIALAPIGHPEFFGRLADDITTLTLELELAAESDTLELQRVFLDIDYREPSHLVINGGKPSALAFGAAPVSALWLNGLRLWP